MTDILPPSGPPSSATAGPKPFFRWLVLFVVAIAMFSNYYIFDALNPVGPLLEDQLGFSQSQIGRLETSYNVAALLVLLAGGVLIDRMGARRAMLIFGVIAFLGGALISVGSSWPVMMAGRFVLGLGAEPLIVAITVALAKWFKGKELSFAMSIDLTIGRLGSVAADNSASWAAPLFSSWQRPLLLAAVVGVLCIVSAVLYSWLEKRAESRYGLSRGGETDRLVLRGLTRFGAGYWWVVGLCVTFYSTIFPFRRFANIMFQDVHGATSEQAGFLNGLLPLTALIATPFFGLLADRIGRRALLMALGSAALLPSFLLLAYTHLPIGVPMAMMGISFSLIPAVMWPSVAYLVDERRLGTAYALMTLCQQIGWGGAAWGVGSLNDVYGASAANPGGYVPGMWLFSSLALLGLAFSYLLWRSERGPGAHGLETITAANSPK